MIAFGGSLAHLKAVARPSRQDPVCSSRNKVWKFLSDSVRICPQLAHILMHKQKNRANKTLIWEVLLERVTGIEPALEAWKASVLPLNHTRDWSGRQDSNPRHPAPKAGARYQAAPRPGHPNSPASISDFLSVFWTLARSSRRALPRWEIEFSREAPDRASV